MNGTAPEIRIHKFWTPKRGSQPRECEDAVAINQKRMVFAVVDGATEAYDSRRWARLFAKTWVRIDPPPLKMSDFEPFVRDLGCRLHRRWSKSKLPWYAEEKALGGSFLAFLVLKCELQESVLNWRAAALGDCCLIQRNGREVVASFPLQKSEEFGIDPMLLPSLVSKQRQAFDLVRHSMGILSPGDDLLLMSDAVACWFLRQYEEGMTDIVRVFDKLTSDDDQVGLLNFFEDLRNNHEIKNDDIGLIRIGFS
jgi:hypothetical protein